MGNNAKLLLTLCVAAAAVLAIPPALTSLAAGRAAPARYAASHTLAPVSAPAWNFQPVSAEMSAAVRIVKNHV